MRAEGVTDYLAMPMLFLDGSIHATSWTTRHPDGFSDDDIAAIRTIVTPLARVSEIVTLRRTAEMLLDTYVGNRAGARILGGQIRRGHNDTMQAAIWLSDLRGFTALSDRLPAETVVEILNQYFDCQVTAIRDHGGEVLKFMGDGLLAVFPIDEYVGDAAHVCTRVLEAARESRASVEALRIPSATLSSASASASRCMSATSSTAISAAATGSTSPASAPPSISPRGWRRSPAALAHRRGLGGLCQCLPRRLARARRIPDRGIFQGAARVRAGGGDAGGDDDARCVEGHSSSHDDLPPARS